MTALGIILGAGTLIAFAFLIARLIARVICRKSLDDFTGEWLAQIDNPMSRKNVADEALSYRTNRLSRAGDVPIHGGGGRRD
jgi:hypothetical protein